MATETPNLFEVQKTFEALTPVSQNNTFDETRIFKTEFDRQMYLASLK